MQKLICFAFLISIFPAWGQPDSSGIQERRELLVQELFFEALGARATENPQKQIEKLKKALEIDGEIATIHYELSKVYLDDEKMEEALFHGFKALELDPDNDWILLHYEKILLGLEMWEDLLVIQSELMNRSTDPILYFLRISETHAAMGNYRKAINELNRLQKQSPRIIPDLAERKKNIWLAANKPKKAEKEILRLVKAYPEAAEYWGALGNFYRANNNTRKAKNAFQKLLEIDPEEHRAHFALAYIYQKESKLDAFFFHLTQAMKSENVGEKDRIDVLLSLIRAGAQHEEIQKKIKEMLSYAERYHPESAGILMLSGDFYANIADLPEALDRYLQASELSSGKKAEVFRQIIGIQLELRKIDEAAITAKTILELFPNQNDLLYLSGIAFLENKNDSLANRSLKAGYDITFGQLELKNEFRRLLGEVNHRLKNHEESDAYFDAYLKTNSQDEITLNNYAYYLAQRKEKLDLALEMTTKSNNLSPNNPTYLDTYAWVLYQRGDHKKALEVIEKAIELGGSEDADIQEHLGDILRALGKNERAKKAYQKAIELGGEKESIELKMNH